MQRRRARAQVTRRLAPCRRPDIVVSGGVDGLFVWDARSGTALHEIKFVPPRRTRVGLRDRGQQGGGRPATAAPPSLTLYLLQPRYRRRRRPRVRRRGAYLDTRRGHSGDGFQGASPAHCHSAAPHRPIPPSRTLTSRCGTHFPSTSTWRPFPATRLQSWPSASTLCGCPRAPRPPAPSLTPPLDAASSRHARRLLAPARCQKKELLATAGRDSTIKVRRFLPALAPAATASPRGPLSPRYGTRPACPQRSESVAPTTRAFPAACSTMWTATVATSFRLPSPQTPRS